MLLVTLNKQGKSEDHRYLDHWIDYPHFYWQSQNATTPGSKRGQEIIEHEKLGVGIHLFVRGGRLNNGKAALFIYCGPVQHGSHTGSSPMSVIFVLDNS